MAPWIIFFIVLVAPFVVGTTFAIRTARRLSRLTRAMRALGSRPGWRFDCPPREGWFPHSVHFPWLKAPARVKAVGPADGHDVTVARLTKYIPDRRDDEHWLFLQYTLPQSHPFVRLERGWSAAALPIPAPPPGLYWPMATTRSAMEALRAGLGESDLLQRLAELGAPAVSLYGNEACFLYYPVPEVADLERLMAGLAGLLPGLTAVVEAAHQGSEAED